tara:strand:+ start:30824 stop:31327 length:504 start_codon:yes stop_codon:yes gene_type:complete
MADLLTYSPEDITILIAGLFPLEGYTDGTFVNITKDIPPYTSSTAADGTLSRVHRVSSSYTIRITLMNTSPSNDILTKLWQIDELTETGKFPLIVKDQLGSSLLFSATSWVEQVPSMYFANRITDREWVIRCSQAAINIGGNDEPSGLIEDLVNTISSLAPSIGTLL